MGKELIDHKHCKNCSKVIEYANGYGRGTIEDARAYDLGICIDCIFNEGIKSLEKKTKK